MIFPSVVFVSLRDLSSMYSDPFSAAVPSREKKLFFRTEDQKQSFMSFFFLRILFCCVIVIFAHFWTLLVPYFSTSTYFIVCPLFSQTGGGRVEEREVARMLYLNVPITRL